MTHMSLGCIWYIFELFLLKCIVSLLSWTDGGEVEGIDSEWPIAPVITEVH